MTKLKKLVVVGGGNMGEALVAGLLRSKKWAPGQITVTDVRREALKRLARTFRVKTQTDNRLVIGKADIVLLAVKPQIIASVLADIGPMLLSKQLVLSIAAGKTTAFIEKYLPKGIPVVRVMPNTPALVGCGASGVCKGRFAKASHLNMARAILETVGTVQVVSEKEMDAVTAVSGSGPAYIFYVAEAMKAASVSLGLKPAVADHLVRQTIKGAGELLAQSPDEPELLRQKVTSPGGTTEAALKVLQSAGLKPIFSKALKKAHQRSVELSKGGK